MTEEEWKEYPWLGSIERQDEKIRNGCCGCSLPEPHGLAALCLHEQPFGFTHEDVKRLRMVEALPVSDSTVLEAVAYNEWVNDLADRIAALLPPTP
jgi:hypothetical protein